MVTTMMEWEEIALEFLMFYVPRWSGGGILCFIMHLYIDWNYMIFYCVCLIDSDVAVSMILLVANRINALFYLINFNIYVIWAHIWMF